MNRGVARLVVLIWLAASLELHVTHISDLDVSQ